MQRIIFIVSFLILFCTSTISQITSPKVGEVVGQMGTTWNERDGETQNTAMGYEFRHFSHSKSYPFDLRLRQL